MGSKLTKKDYIILFLITIGYSLLSFYNLGAFKNPNTFINNKTFTLDLKEEIYIDKIRYFTGHETGDMYLSYSVDGENFKEIKDINKPYVFTWNDININEEIRYLKFDLSKEMNLGEIALYSNGKKLFIKNNNSKTYNLLDEQDTIPHEISFYNSAYFDEIYFARTAYEYANNLPAYEWVHPPLGKLIIAVPIKLFGMSPFTSRLMGNIAGILMIPILYIFGKRMFKKTKYAVMPALLLTFDGFHFAHTRMATVDSFLVLFILLSFLFMYEYLTLDKKASIKTKYKKLLLSALFITFAISTKWTGLFAAIALAIFFFIHFYKNYDSKEKWQKEGKKIIIFCILVFVILPLSFYISLYLLFPNMYYYKTNSLPKIIDITKAIYNYHSSLKAEHFFYSAWYTWPLMLKPVWYYVNDVGNLRSTISGFGNPIVWWFGTLSMFYMIFKSIKKDKNALFILISYLCLLVSYFGISRGMFLYHYFPALPFTLLSSTILIKDLTEKTGKNYIYIIYLILVIFFFYYFFPVVSALPTVKGEIESLKWFSSWYF